MPAKILRLLGNILDEPISRLANQIMFQRRWPSYWRTHWIVPLHKRTEKYKAFNYRGVHLTSHIAKSAERLIAIDYLADAQHPECMGRHQFAYQKKTAPGMHLQYLFQMCWKGLINNRKRLAIYCFDVSGVVDTVKAPRLL